MRISDWSSDVCSSDLACSENLKDVAFNGSLAALIGLPAQLQAQGWTDADVARYLPLMEPRGLPVMAPEKIVMALGEADRSEERRGGKEGVSKCRSRWTPSY